MVNKIYNCRNGLTLYHFDFYRLSEGGTVGQELEEIIDDPKAIIVIEWGDIVSDIIPQEHIIIELERTIAGEDKRIIKISYPEKFAYVCKELA